MDRVESTLYRHVTNHGSPKAGASLVQTQPRAPTCMAAMAAMAVTATMATTATGTNEGGSHPGMWIYHGRHGHDSRNGHDGHNGQVYLYIQALTAI